MSEIEDLIKRYERYVKLPWGPISLLAHRGSGSPFMTPVRSAVCVYVSGSFRLRRPMPVTSGAWWTSPTSFAEWMANQDYMDAYFERPEFMELALADFSDAVAEQVRQALNKTDLDEDTVVALFGLASLFGLARVAELIAKVDSEIPGRLLAFFPGQRDGSNWRLLNARDGWNYHAVPI